MTSSRHFNSLPLHATFVGAARPLTAIVALSAATMLTGCAAGAQWDGGANEDEEEAAPDWAAVEVGHPTEKCTYSDDVQLGVEANRIVPSNLAWQGYADSTDVHDIKVSTYFDCLGRKETNALLILTSATWCGYCQQEAQEVQQHMADENDWPAKGIKVLTLMIQDLDGRPATDRTALNWRNEFQLDKTIVAADPNATFAPAGQYGLPLLVAIDPRTMEIKDVQQGYSGDHSLIESIAAQNAQK
jgi:thiol-disulfide isomerase/thioredoxin